MSNKGGRITRIAATPEAVLDGLRPVMDPELNLSIVDLGLVRGISVEDDTGRVQIDLTLTSPMCPLGPQIMAAAKVAAEKVAGVVWAQVQLVWSPPWDPRVDASDDAKAELGIWD
ncbi:MAG: metal-sulfur cluster assembly factor [Candidatus Krumholzibacteria bacterium]|nr:metal-sulfur cluster assembly factor [Candidatus Krumholzibacteria bacterium]